jgi:hypothetical protein
LFPSNQYNDMVLSQDLLIEALECWLDSRFIRPSSEK